MNELEHDLAGRLHGLADDLTGGGGGDAGAAVDRWRRRRRTRRTLTAVAAVVAAVAIGVPVAAGALTSAPHPADVARPAPATAPASTPPAVPTSSGPALPDDHPADVDAGPTGGATGTDQQSAPTDAEARARLAGTQADLARLAAQLTEPVRLTSPSSWDQWLPASKPYPGADTADDLSTCPVLSAGLSAALGQRMSYWTGTLPSGPVGCDWAPVPLQYDTIDYPFTVSVGFLGDGTTPRQLAGSAVSVAGDQPTGCPSADLPGGGLLYECWSTHGVTDLWLAVPDVRGAGVWVLNATAQDDSPVTPAEAFTALLDGVVRTYG